MYSKQDKLLTKIHSILILCCLLPLIVFSQSDNLFTIYEFNAPTLSPWGLTYDGENFWISDDSTSCIHKIDSVGNIIKSYQFTNLNLKGMTFHENELWVVNDFAVGDTVIYYSSLNDSCIYKIYSILKIDINNGAIIDSLTFRATGTNTKISNFIWGIGSFQSYLYVSYNGGWGPCTYEINPATRKVTNNLCCAHPCGFTTINNNLWCVRMGSLEGPGDSIRELDFFYWENDSTHKGLQEMGYWHELDCDATDLTFDGDNIWICDYTNKKIKKLSKVRPQNIPISFKLYQNYPNPFNTTTTIKYNIQESSHVTLKIYNLAGQEIETLVNGFQTKDEYQIKWITQQLPSGIYFYRLQAGEFTETKKLILQK